MRMLSLPADFFKDYSAGELSNRLGYVTTLADQLVNMVLSTALGSLFSLLYVFQIFAYAPGLVVPALMVTLATLVVTMASIMIQMRVSRQQMKLTSKESGISYALISGKYSYFVIEEAFGSASSLMKNKYLDKPPH